MLADVPENPTPTPPPDQRPLAPGLTMGGGARGAPAGQQYAPPTESGFAAHEATDDPYAGVLDAVHRTWSAALDEPAPQDTAGQGRAEPDLGPEQHQPTPFHDDLKETTAVPQWTDTAASVGKQYGVPTDVALALIATTSKGDPAAQLAGGRAVGLAGVPLHNFSPDQDPTDPATNLGVALGKLAQLHAQTGDWDKAATRLFGAADQQGNPKDLGNGVSGFAYRDQFKAARRRYGAA